MSGGLFITFEGPEGSGKSTHSERLRESLEAAGIEVVRTREPGGTPTGEAIRGILQHDTAGEPIEPRTEVLLFEASRAQLLGHVIVPALEAGKCVICDRFADSTTVYQGYGRGFDVERLIELHEFAIGDATPDVTVLMDIDVGRGLERIAERNKAQDTVHDRIEREAIEFHERVRQGYLELAQRWPERFRVIDADREPGDVATDVRASVAPFVAARFGRQI